MLETAMLASRPLIVPLPTTVEPSSKLIVPVGVCCCGVVVVPATSGGTTFCSTAVTFGESPGAIVPAGAARSPTRYTNAFVQCSGGLLFETLLMMVRLFAGTAASATRNGIIFTGPGPSVNCALLVWSGALKSFAVAPSNCTLSRVTVSGKTFGGVLYPCIVTLWLESRNVSWKLLIVMSWKLGIRSPVFDA